MMENWNNDRRPKPLPYKPKNMQCKTDAMPDTENVTVGHALVSIIPIFQYSNIPHPYGMLLTQYLVIPS